MRIVWLPAILLALAGGAHAAAAHAHLETAIPAPGSTVQVAPSEVSIIFTEGVEPEYSSIVVQDADGYPVTNGTPATAPNDDKRFSVGLAPLRPGIYRVIWHATAVDTHKTQGTYQFTVSP